MVRTMLPRDVAKKIVEVFSPRMTAQRFERWQRVLAQRQGGRALVLENVLDPHNAAACFRNADAFGIQDIHIIDRYNRFDENRKQPGQAVYSWSCSF